MRKSPQLHYLLQAASHEQLESAICDCWMLAQHDLDDPLNYSIGMQLVLRVEWLQLMVGEQQAELLLSVFCE